MHRKEVRVNAHENFAAESAGFFGETLRPATQPGAADLPLEGPRGALIDHGQRRHKGKPS
jgi:hypothetical protein